MGTPNINAPVSALIQPGTQSPLQLQSPEQIRNLKILGTSPANALANDLTSIASRLNAIAKTLQSSPQVTQIFLTNPAGQVIAAFGPTVFQGVRYFNYLSEIHVGNPSQSLNPSDPTQAVFNANSDGTVSIGDTGWFDVHDPYDGNAAWIGTQNDTTVITGAVNNGSNAIRLTVPGHTLVTGNTATVRAMNLYNVGNANGTWTVTVIDASTVDLQNSIWSGPFQPMTDLPQGLPTYQPTIDRVLQVVGATSSGGLVEVQTSIPHTYETGDQVSLPDIPGTTQQWVITVVDSTHFTLDGSTFTASFTGTCLRYYAGLLAETIAIGDSFPNYKLRAFADGSLKIKNAQITLTSAAGSIVLDPSGPTITLSSPSGNIVLNATTGQIVLNTPLSLAEIVIETSGPDIKMYNSSGVLSVLINSNGTITAADITSTSGFTGTAVVRNSAGTGTSSFVFSGGICTSYTP